MLEYNQTYAGVTYPKLLDNKFARWLWYKFCCSRNFHLFDEVKHLEHYLACDACWLLVHIAGVESQQQACARVTIEREIDPPWITLDRSYVENLITCHPDIFAHNCRVRSVLSNQPADQAVS